MSDQRSRDAPPEHRWPVVVGIAAALTLYALLPSDLIVAQRYIVVGIGVLLLIPLIILNPHHMTRETKWSRWIAIALALLITIANQATLVILIIRLVQKSDDGSTLLLASLQVWVTNVIAFALLYWEMDRGGPVARVTQERRKLIPADFRFPQDEDHDAVIEVAARSSQKSDWVPNFIDYAYFSLSNSMAFSATDTMPLSHRAKALMALESFAGFIMLALVIARAVSQIS